MNSLTMGKSREDFVTIAAGVSTGPNPPAGEAAA